MGTSAHTDVASEAVSVAELTEAARQILEGGIPRLWVKGEVSNLTKHRNGHWYFTLRDKSAQLSCVVWSRDAKRIPAPPDEGMAVMAHGQLTVYPAYGKMQFQVDAMEGEGEGLWKKAFEETKARLDKEGLTDPSRKRPIPVFPRRIAVITSPDGAALKDIISVVKRRHRGVSILVVPAAVQGETAPESLCAAIARLSRWQESVSAHERADLLIIGRGGGSREDLWCFNNEDVARAIASSPIPTISAVGHETDFTIADFVADLRAATPSVAAESAVPVLEEIKDQLRAFAGSLSDSLEDRVQRARRDLQRSGEIVGARARHQATKGRARLQQIAGRIEALSPLAVLARGFAVARSTKGLALTRLTSFNSGEHFDLLVQDGRVRAIAESLHSDGPHIRSGS